jgi:carboxypeptidase C (cathepsin A)
MKILRLLFGAGLALGMITPAAAQSPPAPAATPARPVEARRLPADSVTHHVIELAGRTLKFTATAGSVTLADAAGTGQAQIGFVAYTLDGAKDPRPVTFAFNGGPGSASAWVHLGFMGPWRVRMDGDAVSPSAAPVAVDNADTWLDFTDLVFIDPVGTGYSRLLLNTEENRKKYYSVTGDVSSVAEMIRIWLEKQKRLVSPVYILGESYGGVRGPRLVRELASVQAIGVSGLVLLSPIMDYGGRSNAFDPMSWIGTLPSIVASARAKAGPVTRAGMADVEAYATGDYAGDLFRGDSDPASVARRVEKITALTGLDRALVAERRGRITSFEYIHARDRESAQVSSFYDASVTQADPFPAVAFGSAPDAMTDRLAPPFATALRNLYATKLNWTPEGAYEMSNSAVNRAWDFGSGPLRPESLTHLRTALAIDPNFRVLVTHGFYDLVTPYFTSRLQLNAIPASAGADRLAFEVYPGGHMFYSNEASRRSFRMDALRLYTRPAGG